MVVQANFDKDLRVRKILVNLKNNDYGIKCQFYVTAKTAFVV